MFLSERNYMRDKLRQVAGFLSAHSSNRADDCIFITSW